MMIWKLKFFEYGWTNVYSPLKTSTDDPPVGREVTYTNIKQNESCVTMRLGER